jgi:D-beta-D-heptose 7-phosphate kinase / D-beta-D-heptose 1-phosphate adenosyltransferase
VIDPKHGLVHAVDRFTGTRVLVLGDAMLDSYLHGVPRALCREAPVPILDIAFREDAPGGAANTAVNLAALGADVMLVGLTGVDAEATLLRAALDRDGVDTSMLVADERRRTLLKQRVLAADHMLARCDMGSTSPAEGRTLDALRKRVRAAFAEADVVVISDYGYGALAPSVLDDLGELQRARPTLLVVDSKDLAAYRRIGPTVVKPNYAEAVRALGLAELGSGEPRLEQVGARGAELLALAGAQVAAVTLDVDGAMLFERDAPPYRSYSEPRPNMRAAGAGDTFLAALALALACGLDTPRSADVASAAAAVVVDKDGTETCSAGELRVRLSATDKFVPDAEMVTDRIELARRRGASVVFTNGCFDILHRGHITYLSQAKELGDVLVVGLNSDEGVRRLKGPDRPINRLEDRAEVLAALSCVDLIVPFAEDTPIQLLRRLRPEIYVKGGDYTVGALPEAPVVRELGGDVRLLPYVSERSTTGIIERIRGRSGSAGATSAGQA